MLKDLEILDGKAGPFAEISEHLVLLLPLDQVDLLIPHGHLEL